jgi:hypothetical protein
MIALIFAAALAAPAARQDPAWTWTLYADAEPVVLAHEVPDTARLDATLECDPGSSVARLTLYAGPALTGMARISAGDAAAVAEATTSRASAVRIALRTDHPVFAAFAADGRLSVAVGDQSRPVEIPAAHLAKLRRFAELCSG